jgi:hypothetical protein
MAKIVLFLLMAVAVIAGIAVLVSAFGMMRHRKRSFFWMATHGIGWFDSANFGPGAVPHRRRLLASAAVFAIAAAIGIVVSIVTRA